MKLSEMNTVEASNAILRLAQPATNIMQDDEVYKLIESMAQSTEAPLKFLAVNIVPIATVAFKNHRDDLIEVIAALTGKTVKTVREQRFTQTIADIRGCLDKELLDFFNSSAGSQKTAEDT